MKVTDVDKMDTYCMTVEQEGCEDIYRTDGKGNWEILFGETWEPVHIGEMQLESMFKNYLEVNGG